MSPKGNPVLAANFMSKFCFWWTFDIFRKGYKETLKEGDLYDVIPSLESDKTTEDFKSQWDEERLKKKPSVYRLLFHLYGLKYISMATLYGVTHIVSKVLLPICFGYYVEYFVIAQQNISKPQAYLFAMGIILGTILPSVPFHLYAFYCSKLSVKIRLGLSGLIYEKVLKTANCGNSNAGKIINIMSNDLRKFETALTFSYIILCGPIEALLYIFVLYKEIGIPGVFGVCFILGFLPLQSWIAKKSAKYRLETAKRSDARIKFVNEIIQGIQVIKMYTWEKYFSELMQKLRSDELVELKKYFLMFGISRSMYLASKIGIFLSLTSFVFFGGILNARNVFVTSTILMLLDENIINILNNALQNVMDAIVAIKRVNQILKDNISDTVGEESKKLLSVRHCGNYFISKESEDISISVQNLVVEWSSSKSALNNISFSFQNQCLVAIVGEVGSGKSTLLNALLGELRLTSGSIDIKGKLSYASQEPWLFQGTIRENIIFAEKFDQERYNEVIRVCCLENDLENMPNSDLTIVGERGVSLSGGQKARVNLARAIYKKADIYLLDDPLSAVDVKVGKHIFTKCIFEYLSDSICILVTHQVQYLDKVNYIVLMKSGVVEVQGTFEELKNLDEFRHIEDSGSDDTPVKKLENIEKIIKMDKKVIENKIGKEALAEGAVKLKVYKSYFGSFGNWLYVNSFLIITFLSTLSIICLDYFLSQWVIFEENLQKNKLMDTDTPEQRYSLLIAYLMILLLTLILFSGRILALFHICIKISMNLYKRMFDAVVRTNMYFFFKNPSGGILNRFAGDIGIMDSLIPVTMFFSFRFIVDVPMFIFVAVLMNYWLIFPAAVLGILFYLIRLFYIKTSRSVQRIDAISQSPVYSHITQTYQGISTIRGFQAENNMIKKFHSFQNDNTAASFMTISTSRSFAFWLELFYVIYTVAVTLSFLLFENKFSSGNVGLVLLQCASIVGMVQWSIRQTAELENQMIRVERILEYCAIRSEGSFESSPKNRPESEWPKYGKIEFKNFSLKYSHFNQPVIQDLNIKIDSEEKIGIVGRTGAGKSSIIQALYRLAFNDGVIEIDDFDTSKLGLHELRSKISIIPQDPVLFSGTVRYNLDPSGHSSDFNMWKALEDVQLGEHVKALPEGLDSRISEGGSNFSVGQKQLVCLARAILRNNKILIMDEATANVDPKTDKLIQNTIREKFSGCTVLTIAHRLESIMDNNRIIVMDKGRVVEFDTVENLTKKVDGYFFNLLNESNLQNKKEE